MADVPATAASGAGVCIVCGGTPAAVVTLRSLTAVVVMGVTTTQRGTYCRDCGLAVFRQRMSQTLLTGWWGIVSFFINFGVIFRNLTARSTLLRLAQPKRPAGARFMNPGPSVFMRPGFIVTSGVLLFLFLVLTTVLSAPPK